MAFPPRCHWWCFKRFIWMPLQFTDHTAKETIIWRVAASVNVKLFCCCLAGVIYNIPSEICQKISQEMDDSAKRSDDDGATTGG